MFATNLRLLTAALTAAAIFGTVEPAAAAGRDSVAKPYSVDQMAGRRSTRNLQSLLPPDVYVNHYFIGTSPISSFNQEVSVWVKNSSTVVVGPTVLRLTLTKINGLPVNKIVDVNVPVIGADTEQMVIVSAAQFLDDGSPLKDTTFRLDADATNSVLESNETNNTVWYGL